MTHQIQSTDLNNAVQLLADNGFEGMASAIQILFNEAMKLERDEINRTPPKTQAALTRELVTILPGPMTTQAVINPGPIR